MSSAFRRNLAALIAAAAILLTFASVPVSASTLQRTWTAKIGVNGANGIITLRKYTDGLGSISYSLAGLRAGKAYSVRILNGTCSNPGTVVALPLPVPISASGRAARVNSLQAWQMRRIWLAGTRPSFLVRISSGTSIRCAEFKFVHATRVSVTGLGIDLPVIRGPSGYPLCRVAMYYASAAQPREPGISFIFAHARRGMFLPLLTSWRNNRGASLMGRTVKVWTSDSYVSTYRITRVRVTRTAMAGVTVLDRERLWLQTSTGPNGTYPKLIVEAVRIGTAKTTHAAAYPTPHPLRC